MQGLLDSFVWRSPIVLAWELLKVVLKEGFRHPYKMKSDTHCVLHLFIHIASVDFAMTDLCTGKSHIE